MKKSKKTAEIIALILKKLKLTIAVGESCTGGLLCHTITNIPGSSGYFRGGIVAYNNDLKRQLLDVPEEIIKKSGPASKKTAMAMARGTKKKLGCDIGIALTGIAGPAGGTRTKPVGTVFIAISGRTKENNRRFLFKGTRQGIKLKASNKALEMLKFFLEQTGSYRRQPV